MWQLFVNAGVQTFGKEQFGSLLLLCKKYRNAVLVKDSVLLIDALISKMAYNFCFINYKCFSLEKWKAGSWWLPFKLKRKERNTCGNVVHGLGFSLLFVVGLVMEVLVESWWRFSQFLFSLLFEFVSKKHLGPKKAQKMLDIFKVYEKYGRW